MKPDVSISTLVCKNVVKSMCLKFMNSKFRYRKINN